MSKKRLIIISAILLGVLLTAAVAQNVVKHVHTRNAAMVFPFGHRAVEFLTDYLDLTDQQQTQIKSILAQEHPQIEPLVAEARQVHQQVQAAALSDNFDANQVRSLLEQHKEDFINLAVEAARTENQVAKILTPDQRAKLEKLRTRHQERMNKWMSEQGQQENK